eukprot:12659745-Alexandrium_andersonii.AAC.1
MVLMQDPKGSGWANRLAKALVAVCALRPSLRQSMPSPMEDLPAWLSCFMAESRAWRSVLLSRSIWRVQGEERVV